MTTTLAKPDVERKWHVIDLKGKILGRAAVKIANLLRGRHKPIYTPHIEMGDYVIIINAGQFALTGKKMDNKKYMSYSGYFGNEKYMTVREKLVKTPEFPIWHAVKNMLRRNRLERKLMTNLYIYPGSEHPHAAQNPTPYEI
ncbi:MAG: 50S ribosomal protein L13 [Verrucomicrobia bacterium]|nr:MAG: 50S ribosomal protein L13 [Verrucomicrobiota bacterium]